MWNSHRRCSLRSPGALTDEGLLLGSFWQIAACARVLPPIRSEKADEYLCTYLGCLGANFHHLERRQIEKTTPDSIQHFVLERQGKR